jgi:hypothetical protein
MPKGRKAGPIAHGTEGGYQRHSKDGTVPCTICLMAHARRSETGRRRGKCAPGLGWPLEARRA